MMPATIARAASAGEAFSSVSTSPILVSIGPGYTPNTCVFCPRSRTGGAGDLRGVRDIELQRRDAGAVAGHERTEGRDAAGGGVHLSYAGRDERVHDGFADATVGAGDECGLA